MAKKIKSIIKTRADTASAFAAKNIVLSKGEFTYEVDTNRIKIGDGTKPWNDLEYIISSNGTLINIVTKIVEKENGRKYLSLSFELKKMTFLMKKY